VLANDRDPEGGVLRAELVTAPGFGSVELAADGGFVFVADRAPEAPVTFTYLAIDADGARREGRVTITVQPPAEAPLAASLRFARPVLPVGPGGALAAGAELHLSANRSFREAVLLVEGLEALVDAGVALVGAEGEARLEATETPGVQRLVLRLAAPAAGAVTLALRGAIPVGAMYRSVARLAASAVSLDGVLAAKEARAEMRLLRGYVGDATGDGQVTVEDAELLAQAAAGKAELTAWLLGPDGSEALAIGDIDGDGRFDALDARLLAERIAAGTWVVPPVFGPVAVSTISEAVRGPRQGLSVPVSLRLAHPEATRVELMLEHARWGLDILGVRAGRDLPEGAQIETRRGLAGGREQLIVTITSKTALPGQLAEALVIEAEVAQSALYRALETITLSVLAVNNALMAERPGATAAIRHLVGYVGDADGDGRVTEEDVALLNSVAARRATLTAWSHLPADLARRITDLDGDGRQTLVDSSRLRQGIASGALLPPPVFAGLAVAGSPASLSGERPATLPVTFRSQGGVRELAFEVNAPADGLAILGAAPGAGLPPGAMVTMATRTGARGGLVTEVRITSATPLPAGLLEVALLSARGLGAAPSAELVVRSVNGALATLRTTLTGVPMSEPVGSGGGAPLVVLASAPGVTAPAQVAVDAAGRAQIGLAIAPTAGSRLSFDVALDPALAGKLRASLAAPLPDAVVSLRDLGGGRVRVEIEGVPASADAPALLLQIDNLGEERAPVRIEPPGEGSVLGLAGLAVALAGERRRRGRLAAPMAGSEADGQQRKLHLRVRRPTTNK
jgi:hypothetical protein